MQDKSPLTFNNMIDILSQDCILTKEDLSAMKKGETKSLLVLDIITLNNIFFKLQRLKVYQFADFFSYGSARCTRKDTRTFSVSFFKGNRTQSLRLKFQKKMNKFQESHDGIEFVRLPEDRTFVSLQPSLMVMVFDWGKIVKMGLNRQVYRTKYHDIHSDMESMYHEYIVENYITSVSIQHISKDIETEEDFQNLLDDMGLE